MKKKKTVYIFAIDMGKIHLKKIRLYAFHGCMEEEEKIGSEYLVDMVVNTDMTIQSISDNLNDTVDYVTLLNVVKIEMQTRSKLLENVAFRITKKILSTFPRVSRVRLKVSKINPPIGGNVEMVSIKTDLTRTSLGLD